MKFYCKPNIPTKLYGDRHELRGGGEVGRHCNRLSKIAIGGLDYGLYLYWLFKPVISETPRVCNPFIYYMRFAAI